MTTHLLCVAKCLLFGMNKIQYIESSTKPFSVELESLILIVFFFSLFLVNNERASKVNIVNSAAAIGQNIHRGLYSSLNLYCVSTLGERVRQ